MLVNRREFVSLAAGGIATGLFASVPSTLMADPSARSQIKGIAFDAFPVFDPRL
jgi:2-haloacid dehalogenase